MAHKVEKLNLSGILLVKSDVYRDDRGFFIETYKDSAFEALGLPKFVQDNFSFSKKGVLRGLHYQLPPKAQGKLVRCLEGQIWDVAVDVRKGSPTYGQWQGLELSGEDGQAVYVPEGFAHGFVVVSEIARVLYKTTAEYAPELERGIVWNDEDLKIAWPITEPSLAPRDAAFPKFKDIEI
ncbi:MAG: dTDP-4-dehydrorhamnose 3,5-epimerase [Patescibacteria group bacterium]|nr:dTDP-4-dehydrorhamnose 3,5-epimerase [Patescibacteria group bacterium]